MRTVIFKFTPVPTPSLPALSPHAEPGCLGLARRMGLTTDLHPQPLGCVECGTFVAVEAGLCAMCAGEEKEGQREA